MSKRANVGIILQARMGSTRLPGKVLKNVHNKTLLEHIVYRLSVIDSPMALVIATSDLPQDDPVVEFCKDHSINCYRGDHLNVLKRYHLCAIQYDFDHIIRLTADNPFVAAKSLEGLVKLHLDEKNDYTHSFNSFPIGCGAEVFNRGALDISFKEGNKPHHLEHVNEYILDNPDKFKMGEMVDKRYVNDVSVRLTVDTQDDYNCACFIVKKARNEYVEISEAIELCSHFVLNRPTKEEWDTSTEH